MSTNNGVKHRHTPNDGLTVRRSTLEHDVPRSTLGDRVSGKVLDGSKSGKKGRGGGNEVFD